MSTATANSHKLNLRRFILLSILSCVWFGSSQAQIRYVSSVNAFSTQYNSSGSWAASQLIGAPDVYPSYGDYGGAWAPSTQDGRREYLELTFANPAPVQSIAIYETYNPGAVDTIYVKNPSTNLWQVVWSGTAASASAQARIFVANFSLTSFNVSQVRLAINSPAVPGWNEIDAVGISSTVISGSGGTGSTGTLTGRVTSATTGQGISGATVSVAGLTTTTGSDGSYTIANVPVGTLRANFSATPLTGRAPLVVQFTDLSTEGTQTVTASASGYSTYSNNQVVIVAGSSVTLNMSLSPQLTGSSVRFVLNWSTVPRDLDSHLRTPSINGTSYHVYYGSKGSSTSAPYAQLDFDDTNGSGPETITITQFFSGTYKYYVHRYSSDGALTTSGGTVQVYNAQGLVRTFQVPTSGTGNYWYVCDINGSTGAITSVNTIQSSEVTSIHDFAMAKEPEVPALKVSTNETQDAAALTYSWNFGDGTTSTSQNPSKTYSTAGTYTVSLTVTGSGGTQTETKTNYITVTGSGSTGTLTGRVTSATTGQGISGATVSVAGLTTTTGSDGSYTIANVPAGTLRANFSATPLTGRAPLTVQFTDLSTEGTQTVTASASGYSTYSNNQVVIVAGSSVTLNMSLSPQLTGSSVRFVLNWSTVPRDLDSHLRTPSINGTSYHVYYSSKGSSTSAPYAQLDYDDTNGSGPETITITQFFSGTYKYYVHRYSSDGDLTTSGGTVQVYNVQGLVRTFQVPTSGTGNYWYVCDIDGFTGAITSVNRIQSTAVTSLHDLATAMEPEVPSLKATTDETQGTAALTYSWNFGDGTTSTAQNPSKVYQSVGTYTVSLTIVSSAGTHTETKTNYISATSSAGSTGLLTGRVTSATTGLGIAGATVSVGSLSTTTGSDGSYSISNVPVGTLRANFTATPLSGRAPLTVQFSDLSTEGTQTVTASASGYSTYSNNQVVIVAGSSVTVNISLSPQLTGSSVRFVLNWSSVPRDLDSHLRTPSINGISYHVYYSSKGSSTSAPYAQLDFDDTNGSGPETITITQFFSGTYKYYVHRYSSDGALTTSGGTVQVYSAQGLVRTFQVPTSGTGNYWYVCDINGSTGAITSVNRIQTDAVSSLHELITAKEPEVQEFKLSTEEMQSAAALTYSWNFGDGTTSTSQNPSKIYSTAGTYTVSLTITSGSTTATETKTNYITVTSGTGATGTISGRVTNALTGLGLSGVTVSAAGITTTSGSDGSYTLSNVPVGTLNAEFTASPRSGTAPLNVQFSDLSTEGAQTVTATASGYSTYSNNQVVMTGGGSITLNISLSPTLSAGSMRIVLNWSTVPRDLDSHLRTPSINGTTYHVYYSSKGSSTSAPYALLDHDDTNGSGPETITIAQMFTGTYKYYIHRYSSDGALTTSGATVQIYTSQGLVSTFQVPTSGTGNYWYVCDINGATGGITSVNRIQTDGVTALRELMVSKEPVLPEFEADEAGPQTTAALTWNWNFGDGTSSTSQNPSHTYQSAGTYTVALTVSSGSSTDTETKTSYISVTSATTIVTLRNFASTGTQKVYTIDAAFPLDSGFVYGTNFYKDISKATALTLPTGATQGQVREVRVWFGYKRAGITTQTYRIQIFNGTKTGGPTGSALFSQQYSLSSILADNNLQTNEQPTVHSLSPAVTVGSSFFVVVDLGSYSSTDYGMVGIVSGDLLSRRVDEDWEKIASGQWINMSSSWWTSSSPRGWYMWLEASVLTTITGIEDVAASVPISFDLRQNYPNPFNPSTKVQFTVRDKGRAALKVFNTMGQEIATLFEGEAEPGRIYQREFNAAALPSGVYLSKLESGGAKMVRKMLLVK